MTADNRTSVCCGRSAHGKCNAPGRYGVERPAGPGKVHANYACGRHLSWLVDYMTVPGRAVTVRKL